MNGIIPSEVGWLPACIQISFMCWIILKIWLPLAFVSFNKHTEFHVGHIKFSTNQADNLNTNMKINIMLFDIIDLNATNDNRWLKACVCKGENYVMLNGQNVSDLWRIDVNVTFSCLHCKPDIHSCCLGFFWMNECMSPHSSAILFRKVSPAILAASILTLDFALIPVAIKCKVFSPVWNVVLSFTNATITLVSVRSLL